MRIPVVVRIHEDDRPTLDEALVNLNELHYQVAKLNRQIEALRFTLVGLVFVAGVYLIVARGES